MNFSFVRLIYGILGAFLGACAYLGSHMNFHPDDIFFKHINIMTIIIVSVGFFIAFYLWGDHILNSMSPYYKDRPPDKEPTDENKDERDLGLRFS
jgi:hypothetical protein